MAIETSVDQDARVVYIRISERFEPLALLEAQRELWADEGLVGEDDSA